MSPLPKPAEPVDIHTPSFDGVESMPASAVGLVPTAALVFGALAWLALPIGLALGISETQGIVMSWIAIFPTVFGFIARAVRKARLADGKPAVLVPFLVGGLAGFFASSSLLFFYAAIWPSL